MEQVSVFGKLTRAVAQHLLQLDQKMLFNYKGEEYEIKVVKVPK
jgi:hypothetical protein